MKTIVTSFFFLLSFSVMAQTKSPANAIVYATINVIAPEEQDMSGSGDGGRMNMRNMMDGETKTTTWIKGHMVKTNLRSEVNKTSIIRDNKKELTTLMIEMMGRKFAFYVTDSESTDLQRRSDSMRRVRRGDTTTSSATVAPKRQVEFVEAAGESKKIIGYNAKKGYLVTTRALGFKDSTTLWYTPDLNLNYTPVFGGMRGIPGMNNDNPGYDKVPGTILKMEMAMGTDRRVEIDVTKIEVGKEIADKEFEIPKDIDVKPMKEMQGMFQGRG